MLYKFNGNKIDDKSSSGYGHLTTNTPFMNIGHKTQMSFLGKNNAWELRKAETINLHMPSIFRQTKCVDSIVNIMTMFKDVFKA